MEYAERGRDATRNGSDLRASGKFAFKSLAAGTYHVRRTLAPGQTYTTPLLNVVLTLGESKTGLRLGTKKS